MEIFAAYVAHYDTSHTKIDSCKWRCTILGRLGRTMSWSQLCWKQKKQVLKRKPYIRYALWNYCQGKWRKRFRMRKSGPSSIEYHIEFGPKGATVITSVILWHFVHSVIIKITNFAKKQNLFNLIKSWRLKLSLKHLTFACFSFFNNIMP